MKIQNDVPNLRAHGWILDDGILAGSEDDVRKALKILLKESPACGLELSTENSVLIPGSSKCRVWSPRKSDNDESHGFGVLLIRDPSLWELPLHPS